MKPTKGKRGATESPGDAAERAGAGAQVYSLLELLRIERPPLLRRTTPSSASAATPACSKPWSSHCSRTAG